MIIECDTCEAKVDAKELGVHFDDLTDTKTALCQCPVCKTAILGESRSIWQDEEGHQFAPAIRLWPDPYPALDRAIPEPVRRSIEDARKCYRAGVYSAAAVMCGRALEYVTVERTGETTLYKGLQILRGQNQIDDRLLSWAEVLRKERNMGAHAIEEKTEAQDVLDIMDFAVAFCDYLYVLSQKYNEYIDRKKNSKALE